MKQHNIVDLFAPLQLFTDWIIYNVLSLDKGNHLAASIEFFVYDGIKILILLLTINYLMAIIRHYLPLEKIRSFLASRKWYGADYIFAAILGAVTPFCSCSSIPLFVGFLGVGIPIGVTLTFLIASPLISEVALVLLLGVFGVQVAVTYLVAGMVVAVVGGLVLSKIDVKKHITSNILEMSVKVKNNSTYSVEPKFNRQLLLKWWNEGFALTIKLAPYVLVGVGLGAAIHGYVPNYFFATSLGSGAWWTVPLATIVAMPLYANAAGVVPIMDVLVAKGIPIGTVMALMMATIGLSLPEALILKKIMSWKLLGAFFGIVALGIMAIGFTLNLLG